MKTFSLLILIGSTALILAATTFADGLPTLTQARQAGTVYVAPGAGERAVIVTGELAQRQPRGTFNTYSTTDRSSRLAELREINKPPPPPPAPAVVILNQQTVTTNIRIDRARHDRRQRHPRHYSPSPLP